jgi:hypothetical protein
MQAQARALLRVPVGGNLAKRSMLVIKGRGCVRLVLLRYSPSASSSSYTFICPFHSLQLLSLSL